ncbi:MAG: hypothetical protein PHH16_01785 [Candidatus Gracilibacteria bacterium]|nr:hypothetical protein [Candidatus Gracilibacteria bacterium]
MKSSTTDHRIEALRETAQQSARYPFRTEHRGGPLKPEQHRQLIHWARACILHVLPFFDRVLDERLKHALDVARAWEEGKTSVGDARQAAFGAIRVANEWTDPAAIAIARGIGHMVATAHMADHAPGAAEYMLKALAIEGKPMDTERVWQNEALPPEIRELVLSSREKKRKFWESHICRTLKKIGA